MTDISAGKVPVVACVVASWKFLIDSWRQFLPAALIIGFVSGIAPIVLSSGGGITVGGTYLLVLIGNLAGVFITAAILRKAIRNEYLAPTGLAFGQDEARLLGVLGSGVLLMIPIVIISLIVYTFVLIGSMQLTPEQMEAMAQDPVAMQKAMEDTLKTSAGLTIQFLALLGLIVLFVVYCRLSMINAATIGERKIVFFQTWSWGKGNTLRIIAAILLTAFPAALISLLAANLMGTLASLAPNPITIAVSGIIASTIGAFASIPPTVIGAELYRGLKPPGFVAK
jgi:hypothetical protein